MIKWMRVMAAGSLLVAACSGSDAGDGTSTQAPAETPTTVLEATTPSSTTTAAAVTTTVPATTTTTVADTTTTSTTVPPVDVNPPEVEAWWCDAFDAAGGQSATDFAQALLDDFRHGYSSMPAETIADGAEQAAIVQCDPEYGQAVAAVLVE